MWMYAGLVVAFILGFILNALLTMSSRQDNDRAQVDLNPNITDTDIKLPKKKKENHNPE